MKKVLWIGNSPLYIWQVGNLNCDRLIRLSMELDRAAVIIGEADEVMSRYLSWLDGF